MAPDGLRIFPFRGLRYVPAWVSALAAVTSPPYDVVVRPEQLQQLEAADPFNVVRLILPRSGNPADRHRQAAETLRRWRSGGVLERDPHPALYVYEQRAPGGPLQRGLIATVQLTPPEAGVVLPHEEVIPEVVEDRAGLMRAARAQLEPLLLSYRGGGAAGVVERTAGRAPLLSATTEDGTVHRLWAVEDPGEIGAAQRDLAGSRALIADGHHRWATYLRLRAEQSAGGDSPWERGLVLLVDTDRYPLQVRPIHRVLPGVPLERALRRIAAADAFRVRPLRAPLPGGLPGVLAELDRTPGNAFVLTDGAAAHLLDRPDPALLHRAQDHQLPAVRRELDAAVLHEALLGEVLGVPDTTDAIGYLHEAEAALARAAASGGSAVLLRAVPEGTVRRLAEAGLTMPRKSTSFGPKPASGLVLRPLDDTAGTAAD